MKNEMTVCDYGANPSQKAFDCIREEQCDDCFMVDHLKECSGCKPFEESHDDENERKRILKLIN